MPVYSAKYFHIALSEVCVCVCVCALVECEFIPQIVSVDCLTEPQVEGFSSRLSQPLSQPASTAHIQRRSRFIITFEVDIVDEHHQGVCVQLLHLVLDLVHGLLGDVLVDLHHRIRRDGEVHVEDLARVVVLDVRHELIQRLELVAHGHGVAQLQMLGFLVVAEHVDEMFVGFVHRLLGQLVVVAQGFEELAVGVSVGAGGQHGQGGGDAQRGVEDVLVGRRLGAQALVEGEGEVGVGLGQRQAGVPSIVVVAGHLRAVVDVVEVLVRVAHVVTVVGRGAGRGQQHGNDR